MRTIASDVRLDRDLPVGRRLRPSIRLLVMRWQSQGEFCNAVDVLTESFLSRRVNVGPGLSVGALD